MDTLNEQIQKYLAGNMSIEEKNVFEQRLLAIPNKDLEANKSLFFIKSLIIYNEHNVLKSRFKTIIAHHKHNLYRNLKNIWEYQKITISVAACVGFFIAILTGATYTFFIKQRDVKTINLLSKKIERVEYNQRAINESKRTKNLVPNGNVAKSSGTGFLISKGLILTSLHTINNADSIFIVDNKERFYKTKILLQIDSLDCAVLKVDNKLFLSLYNHIPYSFVNRDEDLGLHLFSLGYPGVDLSYTEGYIVSSQKNNYTYNLFLPANPGTSGSPVINPSNGNIIGMISGKISNTEGGVFAYKSSILTKVLASQNIFPNTDNKSAIRNMTKQYQIQAASNYIYRIYCY